MNNWRDRVWTNVFWRAAPAGAAGVVLSRFLWHALVAGIDRRAVALTVFNGLAIGGGMGVGAMGLLGTVTARRQQHRLLLLDAALPPRASFESYMAAKAGP